MGLRRFTVSTALGSPVWNGDLIGIGYALGSNWQKLRATLATSSIGCSAFMAGGVILFIVRRRRERS